MKMVTLLGNDLNNAGNQNSSDMRSSSCSNLQVVESSPEVGRRRVSSLTNIFDAMTRNMHNKITKIFLKKRKISPNNSIANGTFYVDSGNNVSGNLPEIHVSEPMDESVARTEMDNTSICSSIESAQGSVSSFEVIRTNSITEVSNNYIVEEAMQTSVEASNASLNEETSIVELSSAELAKYQDIPHSELMIIQKEILIHVNEKYPTKFYDFCLVACKDDYEQAEEFKFALMNKFNLKGCMLEDDNLSLGRDELDAYEYMMDRSTKVLFFITDKFNDNLFYRRLQNGAVFQTLMSKIKREKCVPIFPNGICDIPLALSGITGIEPRYERLLQNRINSTYTHEIRELRQIKEKKFEELRLQWFKELLEKRVEEYRKRREMSRDSEIPSIASVQSPVPVPHDSPTHSSSFQNINNNYNNNNNNLGNLGSVLNTFGVGNDHTGKILETVSENCMPTNSVNVSNSRNVSIGNKINVTVVVGSSTMTTHTERSNDDDESEQSSDSLCEESSSSEDCDSEDEESSH